QIAILPQFALIYVLSVFPSLETALQAAFTQKQALKPRAQKSADGNHNPITVLCGSLYLVGHFLQNYPAAN
ncbi:MAG: hypothetical protein HC934_06135, partial [Acaryochloridaceae cyanobacterium SU_2_1]|nr:hypothetical protein [Acaryochloridaceae cyanobacterium SU_2_1]